MSGEILNVLFPLSLLILFINVVGLEMFLIAVGADKEVKGKMLMCSLGYLAVVNLPIVGAYIYVYYFT